MPSEIDYARLAAFIDGEGCIDLHQHRQYREHLGRDYVHRYVRITMTNTDFRLSEWCKATFGGCDHLETPSTNLKWSIRKNWYVQARKAAELLRECLPYFILKREQAEVALRFQDTVDTAHGTGRRGLDPKIMELREELYREMRRLKQVNKRPGFDAVSH